MATIIDIELLARADYFVGQFGSNLSRFAFLLSAARHRGPVPFASVDGAWCYHWRMCCDLRSDGTSQAC